VARRIVILGSTGSIGTQALDIAARNPDSFDIVGLSAGGSDIALLARQALDFGVEAIAVARASVVSDLQLALYAEAQQRGFSTGNFELPKILAGPDSASELASWPCDVVLNGIAGAAGLVPTLEALRADRVLALANKESLIIGGPLVKSLARPDQIVAVDSEHSALAQSLRSGSAAEVRRLVLTASGGPFRGMTRAQLADVTAEQALKHPTWSMGPLVTINSSTLMNKGLEVIEAKWLFDMRPDQIEVVVHPQSVVHSMVKFRDGSVLGQMGWPDMRMPILYALQYPERVPNNLKPWNPVDTPTLTFEPADDETFSSLRLAKQALEVGGTMPCALNAANEEAANAFLRGEIGFLDIPEVVERTMQQHRPEVPTLENITRVDKESREFALKVQTTV